VYLLDTNTLSNVWDQKRDCRRLRERIRSEPPESILTSIITAEEILLRGAIPQINTARTSDRGMVQAYAQFSQLLSKLRGLNIVPYDSAAEAVFHAIPASQRKAHPQDCRIASIAIARNLIVVTENSRDYHQIPGVKFTDWTVENPVIQVGAEVEAPGSQKQRGRRSSRRGEGSG